MFSSLLIFGNVIFSFICIPWLFNARFLQHHLIHVHKVMWPSTNHSNQHLVMEMNTWENETLTLLFPNMLWLLTDGCYTLHLSYRLHVCSLAHWFTLSSPWSINEHLMLEELSLSWNGEFPQHLFFFTLLNGSVCQVFMVLSLFTFLFPTL